MYAHCALLIAAANEKAVGERDKENMWSNKHPHLECAPANYCVSLHFKRCFNAVDREHQNLYPKEFRFINRQTSKLPRLLHANALGSIRTLNLASQEVAVNSAGRVDFLRE